MKPYIFQNISLREMAGHFERDPNLTPQCKTKWRDTLITADEALIKLPAAVKQAQEAQDALTAMAGAAKKK